MGFCSHFVNTFRTLISLVHAVTAKSHRCHVLPVPFVDLAPSAHNLIGSNPSTKLWMEINNTSLSAFGGKELTGCGKDSQNEELENPSSSLDTTRVPTPTMGKVEQVAEQKYIQNSGRKTWRNQRTVLFWVITQQVVVISYRRFGTTYRSHPPGSRIQNPYGFLNR